MSEESRTFAELGIPFPLFDAPAKFAWRYAGQIACDLCQQNGLGFRLRGGYIWEKCSRCGAMNGLPIGGEATHATCQECRNLLVVPKFPSDQVQVCYPCLRGGRVCVTQDTELGMISWERVVSGVTHGVPFVPKTALETVEIKESPGWFGTRVPFVWMTELTRTPTYLARQSENWQFCCERPMVYVGEWGENAFDAHAPDGDGRAMFDAVVQDAEDYLWEAMDKGKFHDEFGIYAFRCPVCESYRAHWDMY